MISCELSLQALQTGPGVWRMNTTILKSKEFKETIAKKIAADLQDLAGYSPKEKWDQLKFQLQEAFQQESLKQAKDRKTVAQKLQRERQTILQRIKWLQGSPNPRPERIQELEEQWQQIERRLDGLLEATMT
ncbi:hypothetical protein BGX21_007258, partial [Mortierella sp. AD011]